MKTAIVTGAVVAALAAGAIATPTFARDPCEQQKHNNGTTGAVLGGIAGAVIGSNVAGHGSRTGGSIIGGVAGAAVGNNIGRSGTKCDGYAYYNNGYYDRDRRWHGYSSNYNGRYNGQYGYNNGYSNGYYDSYGRWHATGYPY